MSRLTLLILSTLCASATPCTEPIDATRDGTRVAERTAHFVQKEQFAINVYNGRSKGLFRWNIRGGNGAFTYAFFNEKHGMVPEQKPYNWFKDENPFLTHVRFGNFIFGHCNPPHWVAALGLNLEELIVSGRNPSEPLTFNFAMMNLYIANTLKSGVKPHITFTGTPRALAGSRWSCGSYGNIATPPPPSEMNSLGHAYDELISNFKKIYGQEELETWRWTTWTEPDCDCHFKGTVQQAVEIVRQTVRSAKKHQLPLRIGNFLNTLQSSKNERFLRDFISLMKRDPELDIWRDVPGIGISLYGGAAEENPSGADPSFIGQSAQRMRTVLTENQYYNLPIHVDELGLLQFPSKKPTYSGELGIYGGSWLAGALYGLMDVHHIENINIWQAGIKLPGAHGPGQEIKTSQYHLLDWLYNLRSQDRVDVTGEQQTDTDSIKSLSFHSGDRKRFTAIIFRHSPRKNAVGSKHGRVCFREIPNGRYRLVHHAMDRSMGNAWETHLQNHGKSDSLDYYDHAQSRYSFPAGFFGYGATREKLQEAALPRKLADYPAMEVVSGVKCKSLTLDAHSIHKVEMLRVD